MPVSAIPWPGNWMLWLTVFLFFLTTTSLHHASIESSSSVEVPSRESFDVASARTQSIWAELREAEPTWRESLIDTKPSGIPTTLWQYSKIVFRFLFMTTPSHSATDSIKLLPRLQSAVDGLSKSANVDNDALFLLAEMNFYGNFSHPRRPHAALDLYRRLSERDGNSTAQHMLGVLYATGLGGEMSTDQAKAQMYYQYAAEQGHDRAEMTLANRHYMGIGTVKSCERAAEYYKKTADKAIAWYNSGPPGGQAPQRNAARWVDDAGGPYGEGASWASSGVFAQNKDTVLASFDNVLEFLDMRERQGDISASLTLGKHFYEPPRGFRRNLKKARQQFMKVAFRYWTRDGKVDSKAPENVEKLAAKAASYLGRMFLRGEGTEQNFEKALIWFKRAITQGDAFGQYHMGLMYRDGLGVPRDGIKAANYFKAAAEQHLGPAIVNMGILHLDQGNLETASRYLEIGKNVGQIEAYYYLAEMSNFGVGRQRNCQHATQFYKIVAEKAEGLHSAFIEANSAYERGDQERALIASVLAAEQGYEIAQANVAFLLDQQSSAIRPLASASGLSIFPNPLQAVPSGSRTRLLTNPELAQVYYTRSGQQNNIDSLIKSGDYHALGIGTPVRTVALKQFKADKSTNKTTPAIEAMHASYSAAAEHPNAAQALWNMGWMHENGIGSVQQDFHMAKRYYDLALEMNKEAYLPVKLALLKLRARSWWNGVIGGKVKGIDSEEELKERKRKRPKTVMEWINRFLDAAEEDFIRDHLTGEDETNNLALADGDGMPDGVGDYYLLDQGDADLYSEMGDGMLETLIIIALAGTLGMLIYLRQMRQRDAIDRAQDNGENRPDVQQGNGGMTSTRPRGGRQDEDRDQDRGSFPRPGDPEYAH